MYILWSLFKDLLQLTLYKKMYKTGKDQNFHPYLLFILLSEGAFAAATVGYQLHKNADLKMEAVTFAKAAEKFGKFVGKAVANHGKPNFWKEIYENYEEWLQRTGGIRPHLHERGAIRRPVCHVKERRFILTWFKHPIILNAEIVYQNLFQNVYGK